MNCKIEKNDNEQLFIQGDKIKFEKDDLIKLMNDSYNLEEIKKIIEAKVDLFMFDNYKNQIGNDYEKKIEDLLNIQENLYVKNEIIKQKLNILEKYLDSLNNDK